MRDLGDLGKYPTNGRRWFSVLGEFPVNADRTSKTRTLFHTFSVCFAGLLLFVTVSRLQQACKRQGSDPSNSPELATHLRARAQREFWGYPPGPLALGRAN
jgi:hypothetical protein